MDTINERVEDARVRVLDLERLERDAAARQDKPLAKLALACARAAQRELTDLFAARYTLATAGNTMGVLPF